MPLDTLPTELQLLVTDFLPRQEVLTLSKTCKVFHPVAEPRLYEDIVFYANQQHNARWLVVTLLRRQNLAALIKTVKFTGLHQRLHPDTVRHVSPLPNCTSTELLEECFPALRTAVGSVYGTYSALAEQRISLLGAVLTDDHLEGSVALIASLAINLRSLTFQAGSGSDGYGTKFGDLFFNMALATVLLRPPHVTGELFEKLESLQFNANTPLRVTITPNMRSVRVQRSQRLNISILGVERLREMELIDVDTYVTSICAPFDDRVAPNLTKLVLRKLRFDDTSRYQQIVTLLTRNCPSLEDFEFGFADQLNLPERIRQIEDLRKLTTLKSLRIDMDLVVHHSDYRALIIGTDLLPPSLDALHLTRVDTELFCRMLAEWFQTGQMLQRRDTAPLLSVQSLTLALRFVARPAVTLDLLRTAAAWLDTDLGIDFKVYEQSTGLEPVGRLVVHKFGIPYLENRS